MRKFTYILQIVTIVIAIIAMCLAFKRGNDASKELDTVEASRLNTFIDAGLTVYADEVPVDKVTAEIVGATDIFRVGDTEYSIEPLLDEGYIMLIDGAIEPSEKTTLEVIMASYYAYEVRSSDKVIILKKRQ